MNGATGAPLIPLSVLLPVLALAPFAAALLLALLENRRRRAAAWILASVVLAGLGLVVLTGPAIAAGEVLRWSVPWLEPLGLSFGFRMDGLAWMFSLLILGIGALVVLYAAWYLDEKEPAARFFMLLALFIGAMLGVVLAENLLLLVVFWEATSLSSFLLIGFWHYRSDARRGARMALAITGGGGLCLLGGVLILGHIVGSFELDRVLAAGDQIRAHPLYQPALHLVLLGAFTKSAQFPFHFWLPQAMAAPTPVSAYLHSATMVKAGVFLLARMYPALGGSDAWFWVVTLTGLATLLVGAYLAIFQHDLKGLLAYSTISHLGLITMLFGLNAQLAVVAGVFHILNHATFKASLFMSAGIIDHETGTRDIRRLGGLARQLPITAALGIVAAGAMAGVPLLNGFLSKEMFFAETLQKAGQGSVLWLLPVGATLAGALSVAYSARFVHDVFFGGPTRGPARAAHEPPHFMRVPVEVLVLLCVAVGIAPGLLIAPVLMPAARAALGGELPEFSLAIWHGVNLPLAMSALALVGGLLLYAGLQRFIDLHRLEHVARGGREMFEMAQAGIVRAMRTLTVSLQNGSLQRYLLLLIGFALAAGLLPWLSSDGWPGLPALPDDPAPLGFVAIWAIGIAATLATALLRRQRLLALVLLGAVGLSVSLAFVWFSAPDLALTQILVDVATIVLMMLALRWLPQQGPPVRARLGKWRDLLLAGGVGAGITVLVLAALTRPFDSISPYFLRTAKSEGGGTNVVNVILVDYRGFDTFGEITVLAIAALVIHALVVSVRGRQLPLAGQPSVDARGQAQAQAQPKATAPPPTPQTHASLMLEVVSRLMLPVSALVSVYLFLRGHNLPGGGFIAGLVLAIALVLQFVANGQRWVDERARIDFRTWVGWGLLIAGGTGIGSWLVGAPFLTSSYDYPVWPLVGAVPLASAALFDLGVYLTVVGSTLVALLAIARLRDTPGASR